MGFFSSILSATVKTALTPLAIVSDAKDVLTGEPEEATATIDTIESVFDDAGDAIDDLADGEL